MNDSKAIHETAVKEIIDIADDIMDFVKDKKDAKKDNKKQGIPSFSSIAKASSNLTMVFPVLASRGVSIEAASMVSKALEKRYVSMLQMLFASYQLTNSNVQNAQEYINQFHTNLSTKVADLDDLFNFVTTDFPRLKGKYTDKGLTEGCTDWTDYAINEALRKDMIENMNHYLPENISENSLDKFEVKHGVVTEADATANGGTESDFSGKTAPKDAKTAKESAEFFNKQVLDSDYKKANELLPTSLVVNFTTNDDKGNSTTIKNALVGVKAKLYPIASDDVVQHLVDKNQRSNWIINFIRATTREISFLKDFVFAVDKAKVDALSMSDRRGTTSKMWKVLERRATSSKFKRAAGSNNMSAITTLVISQDEVEYMRKHYNIDMERLGNVVKLFESLNLIGFVIVDETLEVAKFVFDEADPDWETISFTHLEREASDNTYKKVVNLMTKMSR